MFTADERPQKIKRTPASVSIFSGGLSYSSEAECCRQRLRLWNRGSWAERLTAAGDVIVVGLDLSAVRQRRGRKKS